MAEDHFRQALDWAQRQGALSWELRAATSLARMWRTQDRNKEARELLVSVHDRLPRASRPPISKQRRPCLPVQSVRSMPETLKRYTRPPFRSINAPRSAPRFGGPRLAWREGKDSHKQAVCV